MVTFDKSKLMTMGMRLGVGTSLRYLSKNRKAIGRLMTQHSFQPDQLLRNKLQGSGLEPYVEIQAKLGDEERRLLTDFSL